MGEIFIPNNKTVLDLFGGSTYNYQVPSYQRPYSWESEQIETLWEDIYSAFDSKEEEYFLGSVILTRTKDNKTLEIIDGQQRMTTLMILFCALRDLYYKNSVNAAKKNLILGRIKNLETNSERLKLRTQFQHQNQFEHDIINGIDYTKKPMSKELENNKFANAAWIFKDKIDNLLSKDSKLLEEFTEYLLEKVRIITIECTNQSLAIKLFQVLNNRGMNLSPSDLIKSYLMSELKEEEDQRTFEENWIFIENKAKEFEETLDNLFTYYEYYLLASNPKRSLYEELERQFDKKNPKDIIYQFKKMIDYFDEIDSENSKVIYSLKYLKHDVYWKSILLTAKLENWSKEDFSSLAKLLRKFYYIYWIAEYTTSKTKQTSFNIISKIKGGESLFSIKSYLDERIKEDRVISRALKNLENDAYNYPWCKPTLALIEYNQTDESNINFIDLDKFVHVEHILPQGYNKIDYWKKLYSEETANKYVNTIGNLTLLSGKKNIEASNRPFPSKKEIYSGKGIDGATGYRLTQKIVDTLNKKEDWTENSIKERKLFILSQIGLIFDIDFSLIKENAEEDEQDEFISQEIQELTGEIQREVLNFGKDIVVQPKKQYLAFKKNGRNFASLVQQLNQIKIYLPVNVSEIADNLNITRDVSNIGHYGTGDLEITLDKKENLGIVLSWIKKSYEQEDEEQSIYDENYLINSSSKETYNLINRFREELKKITEYEEKINKFFIGFRNDKSYFAALQCRQKSIYVEIKDFDKEKVTSDPNVEISQEDLIIKMYSESDVKRLINLVKYSRRFKK